MVIHDWASHWKPMQRGRWPGPPFPDLTAALQPESCHSRNMPQSALFVNPLCHSPGAATK